MGDDSKDESFPKSQRLRNRAEFLSVQQKGRKVTAEPLLGLYLPNGRKETRIGLTVSSKVGNAVVRARIRRHLREWFRKHKALLPEGVDVVIIARGAAAEADSKTLWRAFEQLAAKLTRDRR